MLLRSNEDYKIGILGCGTIAAKMAATLNKMNGVRCYAVASRNSEKAKAFAAKWNFDKAYGSYAELAQDAEVDLIYIATPHSEHYACARLCITNGKYVLCEKPFMVNAGQAEEIFRLAEENKVFVTEAIWTRYMPSAKKIRQLIDDKVIGNARTLSANLCYPISGVERILSPELAGGALLDLGVYTLNFAAMAFGDDVETVHSAFRLTETGVDAQESITLFYRDGRMASLQSGIYSQSDRMGIVSGDKGYIIVENINNPEKIKVVNEDYATVAEYDFQAGQITGFEYQVQACMEAIENGWIESPYMPHSETLRVMRQMDGLRKNWGLKYPFEK